VGDEIFQLWQPPRPYAGERVLRYEADGMLGQTDALRDHYGRLVPSEVKARGQSLEVRFQWDNVF